MRYIVFGMPIAVVIDGQVYPEESSLLRKAVLLVLTIAISLPGVARAMPPQEGCGGSCDKCHTLTVQEANTILTGLGAEVKEVQPAAVKGLWKLTFAKEGQQGVAYLDFGKKYLVNGQIFDVAAKSLVDAPANQPKEATSVDPATIPLANSIVMGNPKGKKKLFVFTDPECPFCARLHGELKKLAAMEPDLAIYIKMLPLKIHPKAYDKARVILGAKGKSLQVLDKAFSGAKLPPPGAKDARKPVDDSIRFAESAGINMTPTLVLPDGRVMAGFKEAAALKELLAGGK
jgi:thiol:disulfide interchange protein DsbC